MSASRGARSDAVLGAFSAPTRTWFAQNFPGPTEAQARGCPAASRPCIRCSKTWRRQAGCAAAGSSRDSPGPSSPSPAPWTGCGPPRESPQRELLLAAGFVSDYRGLVPVGMYGSWHSYRPGEPWRKPERQADIVLVTQRCLFVCFNARETGILSRGWIPASRRPAAVGAGFDR